MPIRHASLLNICLLAAALLAGAASAQTPPPPQAEDAMFRAAQADLAARAAVTPNTNQARNLIIFVGDGMGAATITAARILQGQMAGETGESYVTAADALPYSALAKTYTADSQVADSAATATAMLTGVKINNRVLGLGRDVAFGQCEGSHGHELTSLFAQAKAAGLAAGLVTNARITHATPAAAYAHSPHRDWEADSLTPPEALAAGCGDIARQLVEWPHGGGFEVMLGGGRSRFLPDSRADPEYPDVTGVRADGRDLVAEWLDGGDDRVFVWNEAQFAALEPESAPRVLGLFEPGHMTYEARRAASGDEPSLEDMTRTAIRILQAHGERFVLLVEGALIDDAHHDNLAGHALTEAVALDRAVAAALELVDSEDTLVIVTADHGHGLTINGYPRLGNPILGPVVGVDGELMRGPDGLPFPTLTYSGGPNAGAMDAYGDYVAETGGHAEAEDGMERPHPALVSFWTAPHGGEDVPVRAAGPWAHLFAGTIEQNLIYHIAAHALGLPPP